MIVQVEGQGSRVEAFTLAAAGERVEIRIDPRIDYGFDLAHLREHETTGDPVRCRLESRAGRLYALEIHDA